MKKLINRPEDVVREMLEGVVALSPATALLREENIVIQAGLPEASSRQVALISGGGSGHEPAHAGYVGPGMLTAAVAGDVFTSPSADAVLAAIRAVGGPAGVLLIVKNYTGDRLNFGLAAEMARAEGIAVEIVVVADDTALRDTVPAERRRGIAGTVLVHKLAGAAAAEGLPLGRVAAIARSAAERISSMGVSLGSCTLPSVGRPGFTLSENEIEIGLGIHGEPGVRRMAHASADTLVDLVIDTIIADGKIKRGDDVALLVNGLGSTPPLELAILARAALARLEQDGMTVVRAFAGTFLSALDMPGFSLSVFPVTEDDLVRLDRPVETLAWPGGGRVNKVGATVSISSDSMLVGDGRAAIVTQSGQRLRHLFECIATALINAEDELARLDSISGDGDLGASMRRGADALLSLPDAAFSSVAQGLLEAGERVRKAIAGSSGPFYATALMRAARHLSGIDEPTAADIAAAFLHAVQAIMDLGGARPGDRTMVDALEPAARTLSDQLGSKIGFTTAWRKAVEAAEDGMRRTSDMHPRLGRASYLGERAIGNPDAGAVAAVIWLRATID
ncbi:dihydroxyacetone kinase [Rhizobium sp. R72]|uniref:dihydroxyacetone kinase family protein n=1 Tax=unclassified Rhizobium TaxID=2613769 RepID=UPI000B5296E8|nr:MULTISPECIES: dihydroxyacetone kinase family protein [unclassified Rhizobium]OWW02357.1 dihydroxyacetone kinase [Rhizobium sp. R72]OWW02491.1 dihydroxyacetone kinase [Rhizobium sp. R711]